MLLVAYDCLLWILILFPLLLGGVRIDQPGLHLELAQLGIPVLIAAAVTFAIGPARARRSFVASMSARAWEFWRSSLERRPARTLGIATAVMGALWALASLRRHWALESGAADLAIFTGTLWNLTHGFGYHAAMKGWANLFLDHQSPINYPIAAVFALFPRAETLLVIQAFGLASGAAAAYAIARIRLGPRHWGAAAVPLLYWAYLPTRNANAFDFHPEVLMLPLFLAGIAAFSTGRHRVLGTAFFVLGLLCKESGGVVLCGIGLACLLARREQRWLGAGLIAGGAALFAFQIRGVPAFFFPDSGYAYNFAYASYGGSLRDLALSPLLNPGLFWSHLLGPARLKFLFWTMGALGFLPCLDWRTAIAALPCYLMVFLSDGDHRVSLYYYYAIEASIGLFWALPRGIQIAERFLGKRSLHPALVLGLWLLFWSLALFDRSEVYRIRHFAPSAHAAWLRTELAPCIAGDEVAAPSALVPHLAARPWARSFPELGVPTSTRTSTRTSNGALAPIDCVVTDPSIDHWPMSTDGYERLVSGLPSQGYREAYRCGITSVFEKVASPQLPRAARPWSDPDASGIPKSCLSCTPPCSI